MIVLSSKNLSATLMLVTDICDEMCKRQLRDAEDGLGKFGHQHPPSKIDYLSTLALEVDQRLTPCQNIVRRWIFRSLFFRY